MSILQHESSVNYEQMKEEELSDVDITNQSSFIHDNSLRDNSNETDSSDELDDNRNESEENFEDDQPAQEQRPTSPNTAAYQQNCLAAAQMMQLLYANSTSSSASSTASSDQQQTSPSQTESEKENIPVCKYCNKVFANFSNLNHHVSAIHLNQSKWVCSQCGKICSSKSNLKVHLRVHLRVKPYHCRWCSYSCMHHSSIRDHLAKLHPDQTHTPLQPGYLFNSQAVPEPEIFNAKGFNVNSFVSDSKMKRDRSDPSSITQSPEKRHYKKQRLSNEKGMKHVEQSPNVTRPSPQVMKKEINSIYAPVQSPPLNQMYNQIQAAKANLATQQQANGFNSNNPNISNLYNVYNMARMFPFMYNPMQMQYSAAQQQHSPSSYLGMLNQNMMQQFQNRTQNDVNSFLPGFTNNNQSSSSSDEHTSNFSYSNSSRSSSLSPENKAESTKQHMNNDDSLIYSVKVEKNLSVSPIRDVKKSILSVDQMLNTENKKATREMETQTESSCLKCNYCHHNCI